MPHPRLAHAARSAVVVVAVLAGLVTAETVLRSPAFSILGSAWPGLALQMGVGAALVGAGLAVGRDPAQRASGALTTLAGMGWFVAGWNNPGVGDGWLLAVGTVLGGAYPVLIAHAALLYPDHRPARVVRVALGAAYVVSVGVGGLGVAVFFNPTSAGCNICPANPVLLLDRPDWVARATEAALIAGVAWSAVLISALLNRVRRESLTMRRRLLPVVVPATTFLAVVAVSDGRWARQGVIGEGEADQLLWGWQAACLAVVALGMCWAFVSARVTRFRVAQLVARAAQRPPPGGLAALIGAAFGDPAAQLLYPLGDGLVVNARGHEVEIDPGLVRTPLVRGPEVVAVLAHRRDAANTGGLAREVGSAAQLALQNERLNAERLAQLRRLQASRRRIVEAADSERRRLERDLHDGAQQKLVTLSLAMRLEQLRAPDSDVGIRAGLEEATGDVTAALADLREIAHGLYPGELVDQGLDSALESLISSSTRRVRLETYIPQGLPGPIESAAYFAVARCLEGDSGDGDERPEAVVKAHQVGGVLILEVSSAGTPTALERIQDRVGALGGTVAVSTRSTGEFLVRMEMPCES